MSARDSPRPLKPWHTAIQLFFVAPQYALRDAPSKPEMVQFFPIEHFYKDCDSFAAVKLLMTFKPVPAEVVLVRTSSIL